jgi:hypothetical protein
VEAQQPETSRAIGLRARVGDQLMFPLIRIINPGETAMRRMLPSSSRISSPLRSASSRSHPHRRGFRPLVIGLEERALLSLIATTTSVAASLASPLYGQAETLTATVTPISPGSGTPTGAVTFYDGTTSLGTASLSSSGGVTSAMLTTSSLAIGPHSIMADYRGDSGFRASISRNITTVAGTGAPGYTGDGGPAAQAQLSFPTGLAIDSQGNLYVADTMNSAVREISTDGTIRTLVGGSQFPYPAPGVVSYATGVAVDSSGNVYVANLALVYKVAPDGTIATLSFPFPVDTIALDSQGDLLVSEISDGFTGELLQSGQFVGLPNLGASSAAFDPNNNLYYTSPNGGPPEWH